jgi:hypothetical protein
MVADQSRGVVVAHCHGLIPWVQHAECEIVEADRPTWVACLLSDDADLEHALLVSGRLLLAIDSISPPGRLGLSI